MKIYCVIITFNGEQWIRTCLDNLLSSSIPVNIIIIDNKSQDKTIEILNKDYPGIELIQNKQNIGFGQANNIGMRKALKENAEYIFLLNQDAFVTSDTIQKLVNISKENPGFGIISPIHLNGEGNSLDTYFLNYLVKNKDLIFDALTNNYRQKIYPLPFINATGWLLTRQILTEVGGFDKMFSHYGEDDNYCQRAAYHNFKIGVVPETYLKHDRQDREEQTIQLFTNNYIDNFLRVYKVKYGNVNTTISELNSSSEILKIKKQILKGIIRLEFLKVLWYKKLLNLLLETNKVIELSRSIVKEKNQSYLV